MDDDRRGNGNKGRKVLLLGTHGQFNIGDELLLQTFLTQLGSGHHYRVNSYSPEETTQQLADRFDVEVFDTAGERMRFLRFILDSDVVVFGGGSILKELNASTGRRKCSTLLMVLAIVTFARVVARKPVLLCNIGVGPIRTKLGHRIARAILRQVNLIAVRDAGSYDTCLSLGCSPDAVRFVPDAVFVNPPEAFGSPRPSSEEGLMWDGTKHSPLRIALNLNRDLADSVNWELFLAQVAETFRAISRTTPIEIEGLPMQSRFKDEHDLEVLRSFFESIPDLRTVLTEPQDHHDVATIIARNDVVVSERLHAIVVAAIIGRPAVALVYSSKVQELVDQLGLGCRSVDANEQIDSLKLADSILSTARGGAIEGARLAELAAEAGSTLERHFGDVRRWIDRPHVRSWAECESPVAADHGR